MSTKSRARERKNGLELERRTLWADAGKQPHYSQLDSGAGYVITAGENTWIDPVKFGATRRRSQPDQLIMLVALEPSAPVVFSVSLVKIIVTVPSGEVFGSGACVRSAQPTSDGKYKIVELALMSKLLPVKKTEVKEKASEG